jgi:peptide-methionine (R)-S-oxide reductase
VRGWFVLVIMKTMILGLALLSVSACSMHAAANKKEYPVKKTDAEWKKQLSPLAYDVLRKKGTERPFTDNFHNSHEKAVYRCAGCNTVLFTSDKKFDSGTGWPSFWAPADAKNIETESDRTLGMVRTEVNCATCGGHLGHVFDDGPKPTGLRYCINGASLKQEVIK